MNKGFTLYGLFFLLVFGSCTTTQVVGTHKPLPKRSAAFLLKQLAKKKIDYTWWGCRAKIRLDSPEEKATFFAKIRMQRDSVIWMSLRKMSVEGARVRITPTQIEILDRQQGHYLKRPFSHLKDRYNLGLSFSDLQDLLVGNPILYQNQPLLSSVQGDRYRLATAPNKADVLRIFLSREYLLDELSGSQDGNVVEIQYHEYEVLNQQTIPLKRDIEIETAEDELLTLSMSYSNIVLNEIQKIGFVVPDSYERL